MSAAPGNLQAHHSAVRDSFRLQLEALEDRTTPARSA